MPAGFGFLWDQDVWTPLRADGNPEASEIFGMLREGIPPEAAAAELDALDEQRPRPATEPAPTPVRLTEFTDIFNPAGLARLLAGTMLSVALLVLLVACANVTNMLLARAAVRSREVAVRTALGAAWARIATQFWIEVSVLALGGAVGGVLLELLGIRLIRNAVSAAEGLPFWWDLRLDLPVLAFITIAAIHSTKLAVGRQPAEQRHQRVGDRVGGVPLQVGRQLGRGGHAAEVGPPGPGRTPATAASARSSHAQVMTTAAG